MSKEAYGKALEAAQDELNGLMAQQTEIAKRIAKVRHTIAGLSQLCRDDDDLGSSLITTRRPGVEHMGLTGAINEIIRESDEALTPLQVKEELIKWGFDISTQKNLMASIHTILKRMAVAGFAVALSTRAGSKRYLRHDHPLLLSVIDKSLED